jgi:hypothetical protein
MNAKIIWKYQSAPLLSSSNEKNVKCEQSRYTVTDNPQLKPEGKEKTE